MPPNASEPLQAALAGSYRIERELGRGGMAVVYLAQDLRRQRLVAIKVLGPELTAAVGGQRFLREIQIAARLTHPHILPLLDSGEAAGAPYYVMPFVEGATLRERLRRDGAMPIADAVRVAREVASALDYAHRQGIVHRDIKPENILFQDGHAAVADFGIARALDAAVGERLTETGLALGTPAYMSPEQATGEPVDARSDLYSLGCVLHEMLAGEPPFTGPTPQAIIAKRLTMPPPRVSLVRHSVSPQLERVVLTALAAAPVDRYESATAMATALEEAVTGETAVHGERPGGRRQPPRGWRRIAVAAGATATLAALLTLAARGRDGAPVESTRLAVLPFHVSGGAGVARLSEGMVDLLSRNLEGLQALTTVDPQTVLSVMKRSSGGRVDTAQARVIAKRLGAGQIVVGSAHAAGGALRLQATLYAFGDSGSRVMADASAEGDTTRLFELVDSLTIRLVAGRNRRPGARIIETAALTTRSLEALKAYLDAERQMRATHFDSAHAGFQRALAADSSFALAQYRLAIAAGLREQWELAGAAAQRARVLGTRLGDRDRRILAGYDAFIRGEADSAERAYRTVLGDYPDDMEATWMLGRVLVVYNPARGRSMVEARPLFDRLLRVEPEFLCPI